jgi:hypothetical protein
MRKPLVVKKKSADGDIHFIFSGALPDDEVESSNKIKMRQITKKEALKPLLLLRTE